MGQSRPPESVLIVDNGADPAVQQLAAQLPRTSYVATADNVGPAGAIAAGMGQLLSQAQPDDWILLVDDDDPPPFDGVLERLRSLASSAPPDVGVVGLTGARFSAWRGRLVRVRDDQLSGLTDVDYMGNGQMPHYRVRAVLDAGVFDPDFFFGFEELEYGLRLRSRGWRLVLSADLTMYVRACHGRTGLGRYARSGTAHPSWRRYYSARNLIKISRQYGRCTAPVIATLRGAFGAIRIALLARSVDAAAPAVRGLVDGWRGIGGKTVEPSTILR